MFKFCKELSAAILVLSFGINSVYANEIMPPDRYKDPVKQFNYCYGDAHNSGDLWATYKVGEYYEKGYGVKPDIIKAYSWYRLAIDNKYKPAIDAMASLKSKMTPAQIAQGDGEYKKLANEESLHTIDEIRNFNKLS